MSNIHMIYGIELTKEQAETIKKGVKLFESENGEFFLGVSLSKGKGSCRIVSPCVEDLDEDRLDRKFYTKTDNILADIDDEIEEEFSSIIDNSTPDIFIFLDK